MPESSEMYLETIQVLHLNMEIVRAVDIARYMGFSKPSVSVAVHNLEENGYINISEDGNISLTASGQEIAYRIYERHVVLSEFFKFIGVDDRTAQSDACKIEHDISDISFEKIKILFEKIKK